MSVMPEQATVFRGGGRRWFTLAAACRAEARKAIKARCECEEGDEVTPGISCSWHENELRYQKAVRRIARIVRAKMEQRA